MSYEETTVANKLRDSLAAHQAALEARRRKDTTTARAELRRAYQLRKEAHDLDPTHTASAWLEEERRTPRGWNSHEALMAFYRQQLEGRAAMPTSNPTTNPQQNEPRQPQSPNPSTQTPPPQTPSNPPPNRRDDGKPPAR